MNQPVSPQSREPGSRYNGFSFLMVLGLIFVTLKLAEIGQVAGWSWWSVLSPFGAQILFWALRDFIVEFRQPVKK